MFLGLDDFGFYVGFAEHFYGFNPVQAFGQHIAVFACAHINRDLQAVFQNVQRQRFDFFRLQRFAFGGGDIDFIKWDINNSHKENNNLFLDRRQGEVLLILS